MTLTQFLKENIVGIEFSRMPDFMPQKNMFGWFVALRLAGKAPLVTKYYKGYAYVALANGEGRQLNSKEWMRWYKRWKNENIPYDAVTRAGPIPPTVDEVLSDSIRDVRWLEDSQDWEDFHCNYEGEDMLESKKTYKKILKTKRQLRELFGSKYSLLMSCTIDE